MSFESLNLLFYLIIIVAASEIFTNAIEALGAKFKFSEGATGSIFAAVGTAMPETMVAFAAILSGDSAKVNEEVGVGAILGAPFMLSTIAIFILGAGLLKFKKRRNGKAFAPERTGLKRDLQFFLFSFTLAFLTAFAPHEYRMLRVFVAMGLVLTYFYYVLATVKASAELIKKGHGVEKNSLYLSFIFKNHISLILLQLFLSLALIILGASGFVHVVERMAVTFRLPVIAFSLLIIPVATELPEKINSLLWIRKSKDTLALGNITGAMVFQGSILPSIGIFLTPWTLNITVLLSGTITLIASLWLYILAITLRRISPGYFILNGCLYLLFVASVIFLPLKA